MLISSPFNSLKVLLVEDDRINRTVFLKQLELYVKQNGINQCHFATAVNGEAAIAQYCDHGADLILMDCSMPVMDGYEATRQIRQQQQRHQHQPMIVGISAYADAAHHQRCLDAGMDACLLKPASLADIQQVFDQYADKQMPVAV